MARVPKRFFFIRHGKTEMNEFFDSVQWGSEGVVEPGFWDSRLSLRGMEHAKELHDRLQALEDPHLHGTSLDSVDLVVTSPLTRTMQTANFIFSHSRPLLPPSVPKLVHPLLSERVYMASDVGRHKSLLLEEFPDYDFSQVPEDRWWYEHCDQTHKPYQEWRPRAGKYEVHGEPEYLFRERMLQAKQWLLDLPHRNIVVVCHWGVIRGLTGHSFKNLEVRVVEEHELLDEPFIDKEES